jgi:hypothetical protein
MKIRILFTLICSSPLLLSAAEITPPNMELGHWLTTVDQSAVIESALASLPESSRAMVKKMMEEKMRDSGASEQCITKDTLSNFDKQVKNAFGAGNSCELNVTESTDEKFVAAINCSGTVIHVTTNIVNSKRNETTVVSNMPGMGETTVASVSTWQSSVCP